MAASRVVNLKLYNSMTKKKEEFKPKSEDGKRVGVYVCGVTAYDLSHIGHARAYVAFDILFRYLKHIGYEVTYVRNFTDVDDKIIKRANELGVQPLELSKRFCNEFLADMEDLQCLPPTHQPRVSEHMEGIKDMIAQIIKNGCAYEVEGDVYFSVDESPNYGQLSGRKLKDNRAGERVVVDSRKKNPADFALWKGPVQGTSNCKNTPNQDLINANLHGFTTGTQNIRGAFLFEKYNLTEIKATKPGEIHWESPWGKGRPGWHIECSAMSAYYLGYSFDIHGGGMDLIFPHHENELAQSCAACSEADISYWVHNGFVTADDAKMSKSLGNFFTIREVTKMYHPLALRYFLMSTHYRSPVNYSLSQLDIASRSVFYAYQTLQDCEDAFSSFKEANQGVESNGETVKFAPAVKERISKLRNDFATKLSDDLHTPYILNAALHETYRLMNTCMNNLKKKQQKEQQLVMTSLIFIQKEVLEVMGVLGLLSSSTYAQVLQQLKEKALIRANLTEEDVLRFIAERAQAKENKVFERADEIRAELECKGIDLMDVEEEIIWRPCIPRVQEQQLPTVPDQQGEKPSPV